MFLVLLAAYVIALSVPLISASTNEIYYVRTVDSSCPADIVHCQTLDSYAENKSFESNRTFIFLSGIHKLSQEIIIEDKEGLSLLGSQNVCRIVCINNSAGFAFFNTVGLHLRRLEIHKCNIQRQDYALAGALIIDNSLNTLLDKVVVTNTSGGVGLRAINTRGRLSIINSVFSYNTYDSKWKGGNVKIFFLKCDDFISPREVLIKNTKIEHGAETYREIETDGCGGLTIVFNCYNIKVDIEDSIMESNIGYFGANIDFVFTIFTNNSVTMNNVTSCNGHSGGSRGAGLFVILMDNIGIMDEFSCDRQKHITKENQLFNFTGLYIHGNYGSGFDIEDRSNPSTDCMAQYALIQDSTFSNNISPAWWGGTAVRFAYIPTSWKILHSFDLIYATFKNCSFHNHTTPRALRYTPSVLYFELVEKVTIEDCSVGNNVMNGIQAYASNVHFKGNNSIYANVNHFGGGLLLLQNSFMYLSKNTHIYFYDNHALTVGGALFTDLDLQIPARCPCFYQLDVAGSGNVIDDDFVNSIKIYFNNNTAGYAGSGIFGGDSSGCLQFGHDTVGLFEKVFKIANTVNDSSAISSDPYYVCFCFNDYPLPNCSVDTYDISVFPGDNFYISAAVVGSNKDGTIPGVVHSHFHSNYPNTTFSSLQAAQNSNGKHCTDLNYTIYTMEKSIAFNVVTDKLAFFPNVFSVKTVKVTLLDCPPGFELYSSGGRPKCNCEKRLQVSEGIECLITSEVIVPPPGSWVGYHNDSVSSGTIFHRYCPYYYCHSEQLHVSLNDTNNQCTSNRSGILCGQCQKGLSLTLGRNQCKKCSMLNILYVLVFAVMGVALVIVLFVLKLTVTEGSINGLIFYANVVKMNQSLLLPGNRVDFLSVFIAWMNLDIGIDLCLFDGMDSISKTFLQFVFPVYIWLLVILVIFAANRYRFVGNLVGERAVQVLATLLLLSYTKLQRVIVTIVTYTTLLYPDGTIHSVWLFDGNIPYLQRQHSILLATGAVFFTLFLFPYTVLLTFFKLFQAYSDKKMLSWVNKFKPVFDAYAGPYKDKFRFWTGFLLCSRTALLLALTLNHTDSPTYNLYTTVLIATGLITIVSSVGQIYNYWFYNVLECISYFNTAVVASTLLYDTDIRYALLNGSMAISFVIFLVVVLIHLFKYTPLRVSMTYMQCRRHYNRLEIEPDFPINRDEDDADELENTAASM